jgi:hypothetical protein
MWRILTILQRVFVLTRDVEDTRQLVTTLHDRVQALTSDVRSLSEKIEANSQQQASERKALILWFENELLKADKEANLLKSGRTTKRGKKR